jgi:probable phosphoglycerate mutase
VWTSDLRRAVETATIIASGEPTPDARLRELDFGTLEGKRWNECPADIQAALLAFEGFVAPGGESVEALRVRVGSFLADLPPGDHLIVTHGGVIRCLLSARGEDRRVGPGAIVELAVPSESESAHNR